MLLPSWTPLMMEMVNSPEELVPHRHFKCKGMWMLIILNGNGKLSQCYLPWDNRTHWLALLFYGSPGTSGNGNAFTKLYAFLSLVLDAGMLSVCLSLRRDCLFVCWASAASHGCTTAYWLIVPPALDVPTLTTRCPRAYRRVPLSSGGSCNLWAGIRTGKFCQNADFHGTFRDLLHAVNLRHGTHGFTSLPKEGVLRIFPPLKSDGFGRVWTCELGYQRPAR
jgi:hypothetical protein